MPAAPTLLNPSRLPVPPPMPPSLRRFLRGFLRLSRRRILRGFLRGARRPLLRRLRRPAQRFDALPLLTLALLLFAAPAQAQHVIELGVGWENQGAVRGQLQWLPSIQGSRKDVPIYAGYRHVGMHRVFWAPSARLTLTNFWSIGGGGNLLGLTLAPAGLGVYLSRPPSAYAPESRAGRWFATATLSASLQLGGNITPGQPQHPDIPDPDAHRADLRQRIQSGAGIDVLVEPQHYPLGGYSFAALGLPVRIDVWGMATNRLGLGFFFESHPLLLEWQIDGNGTATPAYGYSTTAGFTISFL